MEDKISTETTEKIKKLISKIDQDNTNSQLYNELSDILLEHGAADQAKELLEKALGLVKEPSDLTYNLALANYFLGNFTEAVQMLDGLPNTDLNLYQKSLVYFKMNQFEKSLAFALSIKKIDEHVQELLADIWLGLGDLKTANQTLNSISEIDRTAKVWFLLGITTLAEDRDKAEIYFSKSKELDSAYFNNAEEQYNSYLKLISKDGNND